MEKVLYEDDATRIAVAPAEEDRRRITIQPRRPGAEPREWLTAYSEDLLRILLDAKGPAPFLDEIRRDEDPLYVQACLEKDIFGYVAPEDFAGKRLLDFGCGSGASTMILARLLPDTEIVGVELSENNLRVAGARAQFYGFDRIRFHASPAGDTLPEGLGDFDYILFSAVYEHLLPDERQTLLSRIWRRLRPGGVLFLNQTPWRWFPFEGHTTGLIGINYLPDRATLACARRFSKRIPRTITWKELQRRGIRGGTVGGVLRTLRESGDDVPQLLEPNRLGLRDRIDLWWAGYAVSIERNHPRVKHVQRLLRHLFKAIHKTTGCTLVPALSLAVRKEGRPQPPTKE